MPRLLHLFSISILAVAFSSFVVGAEDNVSPSVTLTNTDLLRFLTTGPKAISLLQETRGHKADLAASITNRQDDKGGLLLRHRVLGEEVTPAPSSCEEKLEQCKADLDENKAKADTPTFLFVQMAESCKLKKIKGKNGKVRYEWSSKDMDDETYVFSDRPYKIAGTQKTKAFFKDFDETFDEESGGKPNGVITFRHRDTDNFEGPLITVKVEAAHKKESGKYTYELEQSDDQEEVNALKDFFREGDGEDDGVVEYEMCSLFIDKIKFRSCNSNNDCSNHETCDVGFCIWW